MQKSVNAIRVLAVDMIEKSQSGHPGICMGSAPTMYSLFTNHLNLDPKNDKNPMRDRFILSAGHGSAMLYATLHLAGFDLKMKDLKEFRQLNSKTPGHPEITDTPGIDATSGPLGQGVAQAVGMALAQEHNAKKFNQNDNELIDNYTYVLCGDGDLQEGVAAEASSIAGHLNLNKLIILWDSNDIQLDSPTKMTISEDIALRYQAYGFNYILVQDGENLQEIDSAITQAKKSNKPTLIEVKTIIGQGSPNKSNKPDAHGAPLGAEEVLLVKKNYQWELGEFEISDDIYQDFQVKINQRFKIKQKEYEEKLNNLKENNIQLYEEYLKILSNEIIPIKFNYEDEGFELATRVASGIAINNINEQIPNLIGGSADLSKSNNTFIKNEKIMTKDDYSGKNINFGVREFAMGAITNGIMLYGMNKAFCSTFLVFSDYLKAAIRMAAIQELPSIFVFTHDSIAVGEDGPTHQPIEHLSGLRSIPNVNVIRPSDYNETQKAWEEAFKSTKTPTILILSRQNLKVMKQKTELTDFHLGAYAVYEPKHPEKVLIASGSEVNLALDVALKLQKENIAVKVVSMPSFNTFIKQSQQYQNQLLETESLSKKNTYFIEMASAYEGYKFADHVIGINKFGKSAKPIEIITDYGYTVDKIIQKIKND